jgi:rubrerythrin
MGDTQQNLQEAFAGESQANCRYLFFADKADKEGHPQVARLFRATADAETVHARSHLRAIGGFGDTKDNLVAAIKGENYEFTQMYPAFINQAESENNKRAQLSFEFANEVEKVHHELYQKALETLETGGQPKDETYFVCQVCGHIAVGEAPDVCPICGAPLKVYKRVE